VLPLACALTQNIEVGGNMPVGVYDWAGDGRGALRYYGYGPLTVADDAEERSRRGVNLSSLKGIRHQILLCLCNMEMRCFLMPTVHRPLHFFQHLCRLFSA
jgi:hypothetical protein